MSRQSFECSKCGEKRNKSNLVSIVSDMAMFERFCLQCARERFRNEKIGSRDFLTIEGKKSVMEADIVELNRMSSVHHINMMNWAMNDPAQRKKIEESEPIKKLKAHLGLDKEARL